MRKLGDSLKPRKEVFMEEGGGLEGGLAINTENATSMGRNSYMSIEKERAIKEVRKGKQLTIKGVLRAEMTSKKWPNDYPYLECQGVQGCPQKASAREIFFYKPDIVLT